MKSGLLVSKLRPMYEKHFGLNRRPFLAKVSGSDVFVGPQTAQAMAALRRALQVQEAVVLVAGAPGCGKSTVTAKALDAVSATHRTVRIGRMSLRGTDVLEYLLEELGETELPNGPIRQFTLLREKLAELESEGIRVVIVVEDALRLGAESLAELEALTAADAGESGGAALVVMGDARLVKFLPDPQLARLAQRLQHNVQIRPMSEQELRGYLLHCIRQAGGDFDQVFAPDAATAIRGLSQGIPRVANKIIEATMSAAAAAGTRPISADLVNEIALKEFGMKAAAKAVAEPVPEPAPKPALEPVPEPVPESALEPAPEAVPEPAPEPVPEPVTESAQDAEAAAAPAPAAENDREPSADAEAVIVFSDEPCEDLDDDIPELIQDTLPDLEILAAEIAGIEPFNEAAPEPAPEPEPSLETEPESKPEAQLEPETEFEPEAEFEPETEFKPEAEFEPAAELEPELPELPEFAEIPELQPEPSLELENVPEAENEVAARKNTQAAIESPAREVPDWEKDPTLAELVPDLDALEKAMSFAHGGGDDAGATDDDMPVLKPEPATDIGMSEEIPEITLDNAIRQRVDSSLIDEPGSISASSKGAAESNFNGDLPDIQLPPRQAKKADAELERIASELAKAKTLEDVDDKLAETLFGEELSLAAAEVAARVRAEQSANDEELSLFDTNAAQMAQAVGSPEIAGVAEGSPEVEVASGSHGAYGGPGLSVPQPPDIPASLGTNHPAGNGDVAEPSKDRSTPDPIEDQINTSMTQTLKALDVRPPVLDRTARFEDDDDDDDELQEEGQSKGGFFSRFRRS